MVERFVHIEEAAGSIPAPSTYAKDSSLDPAFKNENASVQSFQKQDPAASIQPPKSGKRHSAKDNCFNAVLVQEKRKGRGVVNVSR